MDARGQVEAGRRIPDRLGQADVDAAEVVHHRLKPPKLISTKWSMKIPVVASERLPQARRAAGRERRVEHFGAAGLRLLARVALPVRLAADDRDQGVTGEADHHGAVVLGQDVQQHHRVRPGAGDGLRAAELAVRPGPAVRPDHQDVHRRGAVLRRPLAEQMGDVDLADAVDDVAVRDVSGQRGGHEDQRGDDGRPAHDLAPARLSRLRVITGTARPSRAPAARAGGLGRLRGAFRFPAGGRAADWRPVDGDAPTGRTLTRLRPPAGRSPLNCGPYAPLGHDASPGQGAPYGRGSSRSSSARLWLRSIAFLDLFLDVERSDRRTPRSVPGARAWRSSGQTRHRPRARAVSGERARPFVYRSSKRDRYKMRPTELTDRCRAWRMRAGAVACRPAVPRPRHGPGRRRRPAGDTDEHPWAVVPGPRRAPDAAAPGWRHRRTRRDRAWRPLAVPLQWVRAPRTPRVGQRR